MELGHHTHAVWIRRLVTIVVALFVSMFTCWAGHAQNRILAPNATITGDIGKLLPLRSTVRNTPCKSHRCRFKPHPLNLAIKVRGYNTLQVSLSEIRDPRFIVREFHNQSVSDVAGHPLLLRGTARIRHSGAHGETKILPVAGSLFFKDDATHLEISTFPHSRRGTPSQGLIIVRAPLSSEGSASARALRTSSFASRDMMCATHSPTSAEHSNETVADNQVTTQATYDVLYMATDFDPAWYSALGCQSTSDCNNKIVSLLNRTAVFYEQQLGITVEVARQYGPTSYSSTTSASDLLDNFRARNESNRSSVLHNGSNSGENLVDLFQLYTGRTMDEKVVGVAFTGVMCRDLASSASHMLVSHKSDTADPVITAHELGHTLNAGHSQSGIMTSVLTSNLPTSFSSVSVNEMSSHYGSYKYQCRGGARGGAPPPSAAPAETPVATPIPNIPRPVPETLKLSIQKKGSNTYTVKTTVSSLRTGCYVRLRAGESEEKAATGTIITAYIPRSRTTSRKGYVNGSIAAANSADATVFLTAEYQCGSTQLLEYSPFVRISPNSGKRSSPKVTRQRWISLLNKAL